MKIIMKCIRDLAIVAFIFIFSSTPVLAEESLVLTEQGKVGVGTQEPVSKLEVVDQLTNLGGQSLKVDLTLDGSITLENKIQEGILVNIIDSALSGSQTDGATQHIFGTRNFIETRNEQYQIIGNFNQINMLNQSKCYYARGDYNYLRQGVGTLDNAYGEYNYIANQETGFITNAYGNLSYLLQEGTGNIANSFGYYAGLKQTAGTATKGYLFFGAYSGTYGEKWGIYLHGDQKNYMAGSLGLGTNSPQYKLDVKGIICGDNVAPSDGRWKENIQPIENALELVTGLQGVSYEWIDKSRGEGLKIGVIAQEVEKVFPEVVYTDSEGYKSVEYDKLIAPLIQAIKELKTQNEQLKIRVTTLEKELKPHK